MKFIDNKAEEEYISFITSRSHSFITASLIFMIITNAILYIPDITIHDTSMFSKIRSFTGLPIWMIASALIFNKRTLRHRVSTTTVALILTLVGEFIAMLPLSYAATDVYILYIFRVLDVTSTSFCLPLRPALLVYVGFGVGCVLLPFGGNMYFSFKAPPYAH